MQFSELDILIRFAWAKRQCEQFSLASIPALCIARMSSAINLVSFVSKGSRCSRLRNVPRDFKIDAGIERRRATRTELMSASFRSKGEIAAGIAPPRLEIWH
jgi:hypothetical protein